jgi:hypothetical protein
LTDEGDESIRERRDTMRTFIILALVLLLLAVVGWVSFSRTGTKASINLETNQIKQDTREMVDTGKEMLHDGAKTVNDAKSAARRDSATPVEPATGSDNPKETVPPADTATRPVPSPL